MSYRKNTAAVIRGPERGSAVLESALVFLPMFAIFLAIMDFSIAIFAQNVLRHAVREGVRFAITQQTGANGQDSAIKAVVQQNSMGFLSGSALNYITITYYDQNTLAVATGAGSNSAGNVCVVRVQNYPWTFFAPLWQSISTFMIGAASSDVMESPPNGILPAR